MIRKLFCLPLLLVSVLAFAQSASSKSDNASDVLQRASRAFSSEKTVRRIGLTGTATWHAGSLEDSGRATLVASSDGAAEVRLQLAKKGVWTETQSAITDDMSCQWSDERNPENEAPAVSCMRSTVWFLPSITLQASSIPKIVGVADLGVESHDSKTYLHLQSQSVSLAMSRNQGLLKHSLEASSTDIGIDAKSLLPAYLKYKLQADNGSLSDINVEIRYSDYRQVDGVSIPFAIQRYLNGYLQLEIQIDSAQIS